MSLFTLTFRDTFASTSEFIECGANSIDEALDVGFDYAATNELQFDSVHGPDGDTITITATSLGDRFRIHECRFLLATDAGLIEESISALTLDMAIDLIQAMYHQSIPVAVMTHNMRYRINSALASGENVRPSWRWITQ